MTAVTSAVANRLPNAPFVSSPAASSKATRCRLFQGTSVRAGLLRCGNTPACPLFCSAVILCATVYLAGSSLLLLFFLDVSL